MTVDRVALLTHRTTFITSIRHRSSVECTMYYLHPSRAFMCDCVFVCECVCVCVTMYADMCV